jgi:hypothetical protein
MLMAKHVAAPDHITFNHVENGSKANETTEAKRMDVWLRLPLRKTISAIA